MLGSGLESGYRYKPRYNSPPRSTVSVVCLLRISKRLCFRYDEATREIELNKLVHSDFKKLVAIYRKAIGMPPGPTPVATASEMIRAILAKEFPDSKNVPKK